MDKQILIPDIKSSYKALFTILYTCDVCKQVFTHKASLPRHKKRFPNGSCAKVEWNGRFCKFCKEKLTETHAKHCWFKIKKQSRTFNKEHFRAIKKEVTQELKDLKKTIKKLKRIYDLRVCKKEIDVLLVKISKLSTYLAYKRDKDITEKVKRAMGRVDAYNLEFATLQKEFFVKQKNILFDDLAMEWSDEETPEWFPQVGTDDDSEGPDDDSEGTYDDSEGTDDDSEGTYDDSEGTDDDSEGTYDDSEGTDDQDGEVEASDTDEDDDDESSSSDDNKPLSQMK